MTPIDIDRLTLRLTGVSPPHAKAIARAVAHALASSSLSDEAPGSVARIALTLRDSGSISAGGTGRQIANGVARAVRGSREG